MRVALMSAAWLVAVAGSAMAFAGDDHSTHAGIGGVWWETVSCCGEWGAPDEEKVRGSYDEATGRSLLNYPPHRFADHLHMKLEVRIPDMNTPRLEAVQTLTMAPVGMELPEVSLNCGPKESMQITGVALHGSEGAGERTVTFDHQGEELRVVIEPAVPVGERFDLVINYVLTEPGEGMIWTPESPAWPGRAAQLHTQGQPESNRYWFPCHDFPNERLTTEIIATVPTGFTVVSNGRLVTSAPAGETVTYHWLQDKEHVNYLVSMVVGKFDVVDVGTGRVPMPVYAPQGLGRQVTQTYGRTGSMVRVFEKILEEPYPWDKYAQVIVHNFAAGGMENTSATTMYDTAVLDRAALLDGDLDGLIAHELAHQWFGDLMTCNSWEHIWLNEGFATFFSNVWFEERDGLDAYMAGMYQTYRGVARSDKADAPYRAGMVSKEYAHPWDVFRRGANPYPKGASVLHMLRARLGDKLFLDGLRLYVDRYKGKTVETDDLRHAMEEVSGLSLDRFFRQWCTRPGIPVVDVNVEWDSAASALTLRLTQTQNIDGYNPAFFFTLPVWVQTKGSNSGEWLDIEMDGREVTATFPLRAEPVLVAPNANLAVLADLRVTQSPERWVTQVERGPTASAKMQAIDALRTLGEKGERVDGAAEALLGVMRGGAHHSLKSYAAGALLSVGGQEAWLRAMRQLPSDARVRSALVGSAATAAADMDREGAAWGRLMDDLRRLAKRDESYGVRSAAIRALGSIGAPEGRSVIIESLDAESQHDQIRRAALDALVDMDDREGLDIALRYAAPGLPARTRPEAVRAIGAFAEQDRARAVAVLVQLMNDPEQRTARAAGDALVLLGGDEAATAVRDAGARARGAVWRATCAAWEKKLAASQTELVPDDASKQ